MEKKDRLIFMSNDDSYLAPGFAAAIEVAREFGRVIAVAPLTPQSGRSQAVTMTEPLFLELQHEEEGLQVYSLSGTPVDCVKMAFDHLLVGQKVDLVVSGINHGSNAGINVLYSGTMGAAIEGSFYGVPSVGLSVDDHSADADFEGAVECGERIIRAILDNEMSLPRPLCLNVNVPRCAASEIQGIRLCRQTRGFWREDFYARQDPQGRDYFWLTGAFQNAEPEAEDTDEWALAHKYVSVVPVQVDMTDYRMLKSLDGIIK